MAGFPDTALLLSNADPNDPAATDSWTEVGGTRLYRLSNAGRGRQYELGQFVVGQLVGELLNIDEYLNPGNASSPLAGNTKLMRRIRWMCMYPRGGTGNLLNATNPLPSAQGGYVQDGSFESYAAGPAPAWILKTGGVTPTVTTTTPQQGTKCLTFGIVGNSTQQGVGYNIATIPGRTYTAQVQVRSTAANTMQIFINGGVGGTTSAAVNTYSLLTVTFTATQPVHQVWVSCFTPTLAATVFVDAMMTEPGGTASPFTTSGPRIRGLWGGHVSALPVTWEQNSNGYIGIARPSAVGPLAALAQIGTHTDYAAMLASKKPDYWWTLGDGSNATAWAEVSGNNAPPLIRTDRPATASGSGNPPTFSAGTAMAVPGDPGATGVQIDYPSLIGGQPVTYLQTGAFGAPSITVDATGTPSAITVAIWARWTTLPPSGTALLWALIDNGLQGDFVLEATNGGFYAIADRYQSDGSNLQTITSASGSDPAAGQAHLIVCALTTDASGNTQTKIYVDGALKSTSPLQSGRKMPNPFNVVTVGAFSSPKGGSNFGGMQGGTYDDLAIWRKELSAQDVTDLWTAGQGYAGETTGQRLSRLLGLYYVGPKAIDTGRTKLNPSGAVDGTKLQQVAQRTVDSEMGNLFENRDGALEFDGRDTRFLATVPVAVFGENTAAGEIPYQDGPLFGYDLTQVTNDATVTQTGGTKAVAADVASQKSYYPRSTPVQTDTQSSLEAGDYANWLVANRRQPKQRVEKITLDPGANPTLWPVVIDLEIGQRYTVKRNAKAANGGAGLTMNGDFFLENINHRGVDPEKGTWLVDLILSPVPLQPWILGDSTYGQLGITTVPGF